MLQVTGPMAAAPPATREMVGQASAPPTIDSPPMPHPDMQWGTLEGASTLASVLFGAFLLASPVAALLYGFVFAARPPSLFRTMVKTLAVGTLALLAAIAAIAPINSDAAAPIAVVWGILAAGFGLCAIGDAFLAGDPKRWLAPGLAAFLLGHICFIALFGHALALRGMPTVGPAIWAGMALVVLAGGAMLAWLWPDLGSLRWPVVAYVVVIVVMACTGLIDAAGRPAWAIGGLMFMASDAILAVQLFKQRELLVSPRLNAWAIWFLYYAAQVAFLIGAFQ